MLGLSPAADVHVVVTTAVLSCASRLLAPRRLSGGGCRSGDGRRGRGIAVMVAADAATSQYSRNENEDLISSKLGGNTMKEREKVKEKKKEWSG